MYLKNHLDLDGDVAGEGAHAHGAAGGSAVLAPDFDHQIAETVDDLGVILEIGGAIDHSQNFDDADDPIQAAELFLERRENRQTDLSSGGDPLLFGQIVADSAADQRVVGLQRSVAGDVTQLADDHDWRISAGGFRGFGEFQFQFCDAGFSAHGVDLQFSVRLAKGRMEEGDTIAADRRIPNQNRRFATRASRSTMPRTFRVPLAIGDVMDKIEIGQLLIMGGIVAALVFGVALLVMFLMFFNLWLRAFVTRAGIGIFRLVTMKLRKVNPQVIVDTKVMAVQAGLTDVMTSGLEAHFLAGGNVRRVVQAMIAAHRAKIALNWDTASAIDLAGRNVLEAVQTSVNPKVIDCPDAKRTGRQTLDGVAKNGIQLKVRARVTVRTNLDQLIGGATEETIIARVGEGIVSAIGSSETHLNVLENPTLIAHAVLAKGLDAQTAFEIVSIDIADIDVGENVGARLQADQAEADMRVARAKAEERRAKAVATEQQMKALTAENRAQVVLAESEVPKSIASAFLAGNLRSKAPV